VLYFVITTVLAIRMQQANWIGPVGSTGVGLVALVVIILVGEVLPKLVAARLTVGWSKVSALPLWMVHRTLTPVRIVCSAAIIAPLARLIAPRHKPLVLSVDEFDSLLRLSQHHGVIDSDEEHLLQQVLELSQLKVRHLMTPRVDMIAHDLNDDPGDLIELIRKMHLRHIPVYRDTLDKIEGLVYARQVLLARPASSQDMEKLVRQVRFVPELQRADQLLVEMRKTRATFAIAVDEYGGTSGLITLEDVVEHMVGEIPGAFDEQTEPRVETLRPGVWRTSADLPVHEWADVFKRHARSDREGLEALAVVSTVGGLMMARLGRLPREGDRVTIGNVALICESMRDKRIDSIRIELTGLASKEAGDP
jgi:CBS domain containing-hemolysin-like protein